MDTVPAVASKYESYNRRNEFHDFFYVSFFLKNTFGII